MVINYRTLFFLVCLISSVVIFGWHIKSPFLVQLNEQFVPMQYNTALCFLLCGILSIGTKYKKLLSLLFTSIISLTLLQYVLGDLFIDTLFMEPWVSTNSPHPGRMAIPTALCFLLYIVFFNFNIKIINFFILFISSFSLLGYATHLDLYTWFQETSMAVHTAFSFLLFSLGSILKEVSSNMTLQRQYKQTAKELRKVNNELLEFSYVVSHDLRAPLRGIKNLASWIKEDPTDNIEEHCDLLMKRVDRMSLFIEGLLEYSRIGRMDTERIFLDLNEVLESICVDFRNDKVEINFNKMPSHLNLNKVRVGQIFSNLIDNAIKYNDKDICKINVFYLGEKEGLHKFYVKDNGPGIDMQYKDKIFEMFQTLVPKDDLKDSVGIGLSLVKKIVNSKGGEIWLESELGKYACFYFTLRG